MAQTSASKRVNKGCLIAIGIMASVLVVSVVFLGFVAYRIAEHPKVRKLVGRASKVVSITLEAAQAPGAEELAALGCQEVMVFDRDKWLEIEREWAALEDFADDASDRKRGPIEDDETGLDKDDAKKVQVEVADDDVEQAPPPSPLVFCMVKAESDLTCEDIVRKYVEAVPSAGEALSAMIVEEHRPKEDAQRCGGVYKRDGTFIRAVDEEGFPGRLLRLDD